MMSRLNIVLAVLLVAVVVLTVVMRPDPTRPNFEFLPDMKYSPAPLAYAPSDVFANGRTLQAPVAGTIPRGAMPLHYEASKEDAVRAGEELTNPYQEAVAAEVALAAMAAASDTASDDTATGATDETSTETNAETTESAEPAPAESESDEPESAEPESADPEPTAAERLQASVLRGSEAYRVYCITCHGATGEGDGPVAKRGFPPPPSLLTGNSRMMKDGQLFHILTYGQVSMPKFAAELLPDARWDLINYIRDMQPPIEQPVPSAETPAETPAATGPAEQPATEPASEDSTPEPETADTETTEAETEAEPAEAATTEDGATEEASDTAE